MNIGIEYLVRTGAAQNFLQAPCSLFLEHWLGGRLVILIENKSGRSKFYRVTHYDLEQLADDERFPFNEEHNVPKDEVFESDKLILAEAYSPLPYIEQPVENHFNKYNHPMDEHTYNHFLNHYLHSEAHKQMRERWLWKSFVKLHVKRPLLSLFYYERYSRSRIASMEQSVVKEEEPEKWMIWVMWRKKLLRSTRVAPELIFWRAYG